MAFVGTLDDKLRAIEHKTLRHVLDIELRHAQNPKPKDLRLAVPAIW